MRIAPLFALSAMLVLVPACAQCGKSAGGQRPRVVVSIFPIYDLTRRVAGPDADVALLVPTGRSEHGFQPSAKEAQAAAGAKLGVMVGLGLDPWMQKLLSEASPSARLLKVGDRVPTLPAGGTANEDEAEAALDPHVWLDPQRAQLIVRAIAEELSRVDTPHALAYRERATEIDRALSALDVEAEKRTSALGRRSFVTLHDGFRYFAERYRLKVLAVVEPTPGEPPPREHLAKIAGVAKTDGAPVFGEPQLEPGPAKDVAEQAGVPLGVLDPLGGGAETVDYEATIRFDLAQLEKHLK